MHGVGAVPELKGRWYAETLRKKLMRPFVHILFGARQTGKSTLLDTLLPPDSLRINLAIPEERSLHLARPDAFRRMCLALPDAGAPHTVFVDEAQNVPHLFDAVQSLYDADRKRWLSELSAPQLMHFMRSWRQAAIALDLMPRASPTC